MKYFLIFILFLTISAKETPGLFKGWVLSKNCGQCDENVCFHPVK